TSSNTRPQAPLASGGGSPDDSFSQDCRRRACHRVYARYRARPVTKAQAGWPRSRPAIRQGTSTQSRPPVIEISHFVFTCAFLFPGEPARLENQTLVEKR